MTDPAMASERQPTLYLVTPDEHTIGHLERLFAGRGFHCEVYRSAGEFLAARRAGDKSCVIMASQLPDMSGVELVQQMHRQGGKTPTIVLSDDRDVNVAVQAFRAGAVDFLELPFVDRVLLDRVNELFSRLEGQ